MYGKIFQIGIEPIKRDDYIETAVEGEMVVPFTCIYETEEENRKIFIQHLVEHVLPAGLFTIDSDGDTLTFQGGFDKWRDQYLELIRSKAADIDESNIMDWCGPVYQLQKAIANPFGGDTYFVSDYIGGAVAVNSRDFMGMVKRLEPGAKLYIGAILSYHAY